MTREIDRAMKEGKATPGDRVLFVLSDGGKGEGIVLDFDFEYECFYVSNISGDYEYEPDEDIDERHSLVYARIGEIYHIINRGL